MSKYNLNSLNAKIDNFAKEIPLGLAEEFIRLLKQNEIIFEIIDEKARIKYSKDGELLFNELKQKYSPLYRQLIKFLQAKFLYIDLISPVALFFQICQTSINFNHIKKLQNSTIFSITQSDIISNDDLARFGGQKTLQTLNRIVGEAMDEIVIFGYTITYPNNPVLLTLKEMVTNKFVKLKIIGDKSFFSVFKYIWGNLPHHNIELFTPKFESENQLMHAKMAIIDNGQALITSANLTYNGMNRNLEIGVLLEGKSVINLVEMVHLFLSSENISKIHWNQINAIPPKSRNEK
jgi:hypothetical protein